MYKRSSEGSSRTSIRDTTFGWSNFFIIAISCRIRSNEFVASGDGERVCLCNGRLNPFGVECALARPALALLSIFDCALFLSRDFENSLTAYNLHMRPEDLDSNIGSNDIQIPDRIGRQPNALNRTTLDQFLAL